VSALNRLELRVPPLALVAIAALGMWIAARRWPGLSIYVPARVPVAIVLAASGLAVAAAGIDAFSGARTTVDPTRPERASALVATGIYLRSRNPMYLGFLMVLAAWAWFLGNAAGAVALPAFVAYMNRFQIGPEERLLRQKFGREYDEYLLRIRRWL
jgi:protein-S-isoprenylcysteine O-methyltransferase Ste14